MNCMKPCPPIEETVVLLEKKLLEWIDEKTWSHKIIRCFPADNTEAWVLAAYDPGAIRRWIPVLAALPADAVLSTVPAAGPDAALRELAPALADKQALDGKATAKAMRAGKLALMRPVMTSVDGRWVATTRWMPVARAICAKRQR